MYFDDKANAAFDTFNLLAEMYLKRSVHCNWKVQSPDLSPAGLPVLTRMYQLVPRKACELSYRGNCFVRNKARAAYDQIRNILGSIKELLEKFSSTAKAF